ncbi:hypothetical protein ES708_08166 [subsurface metagenome]
MEKDRKKIKREKKRIQDIRRNKRKHNIDFIFPKKRDIRFSDPKEKK